MNEEGDRMRKREQEWTEEPVHIDLHLVLLFQLTHHTKMLFKKMLHFNKQVLMLWKTSH